MNTFFRADQYRPSPPYPVDSKRFTADYYEIKNLGGNGVTTPSARTPDQTQIAIFWYESSPLGWNRIARTVSASRGLGLWENARLFALLNFASADGYIASFDAKYYYNYWRPITAIRLGDTDGNPDTVGDPTWTPLLDTPPIPDYDSGHSVQGGAMSEIMRLFFGTDNISFSTCSTTMPAGSTCNDPSPVTRSFTSFSQAAAENGLSRILVGIHFRKAVTEGIQHGGKIAHHTFVHYLRPIPVTLADQPQVDVTHISGLFPPAIRTEAAVVEYTAARSLESCFEAKCGEKADRKRNSFAGPKIQVADKLLRSGPVAFGRSERLLRPAISTRASSVRRPEGQIRMHQKRTASSGTRPPGSSGGSSPPSLHHDPGHSLSLWPDNILLAIRSYPFRMAALGCRASYNCGMVDPNRATEDLVGDCQRDRSADESFRILFRRYFGQVQWFFQRKGVPPEDARDMTQEVFLAVFRGLPQLQDPNQFASWLFVIARNVFHHHLEKQHAQKRSWAVPGTAAGGRAALDPDAIADSRAPGAAEMVLDRERVAKLGEALRNLPSQMRRCIQLRTAEECSYDDIAVLLGISIGTVKSHIHRAREKLREELRAYFGEAPG